MFVFLSNKYFLNLPEPQIEQTYWNDLEDKISGQKFINRSIVCSEVEKKMRLLQLRRLHNEGILNCLSVSSAKLGYTQVFQC